MENTYPELPVPECPMGFTAQQVVDIMGDRITEFDNWMSGQTGGICNGKRYNYDKKMYEPMPDHDELGHGVIYYVSDVERFLAGRPVID